ncbi:MAG: F-box protein [Alphaproteobacteria bacterium]
MASDGQDHLTPLPDEVKQHILGHISPKDLGAMAGVSKDLHNHANDEGLWRQKAMEAGLTTKPEGMTWKEFYIQNSTLMPAIQKLKAALDEAGSRQNAVMSVIGVTSYDFNSLMSQNKSPQEIYAYVKKEYESYKIAARGHALTMPIMDGGILKPTIVLRLLEKELSDLQSHLQWLPENDALEEGVLAAYEKRLPILSTKDGKLIPIPEAEPAIAVLKARHAVREAIKHLLAVGAKIGAPAEKA